MALPRDLTYFLRVRRGRRGVLGELRRSLGSACLLAPPPPARSPALFIVLVPTAFGSALPTNQNGGKDEWQSGPPIVSRRGCGGRPRPGRHVRIVGPSDRASLASAGARHGAAGEPPRHLPWGDPEFPGVRLGAHDVGGCGGHGERCPSRLAPGGRARGPPRGSAAVAAVPLPWGAVSVRCWERKRLSEGPAFSRSAS